MQKTEHFVRVFLQFWHFRHIIISCFFIWKQNNPAWAHASKIVANGPRNDGPFQEGRSCALGRRCTILSNRRPSSHEWIPTAHRSNQPVRNEVYCNLPAAAKQSVARRDMMLVQLQHFGDLHLIARNFAMCAYILEHHSIHLNPLQSIHCSEQPLHSPAAGFHERHSNLISCGSSKIAISLQFLFWHSNFMSRGSSKIAILLQFLKFEFHFVRKSCRQGSRIAILFQFLTFRAKRLPRKFQNRNFTSVFDTRTSFRAKGWPLRGASSALPAAL